MKKQIQLIGLIAALVIFVGIIFKAQHWPGASALILLGSVIGLSFMLVYLFKGIQSLSAGLEKTTGTMGAIALMLVLIAFLFKTQHWPGASILLVISQLGLLISSVLGLLDAYNENDSVKQSIKSLFSFTIFILMSILLFLGFMTEALNL